MPRVSVVIPTFGRARLVTRAVGCALGQTMPDLEVIVVIDGPDAETRTVLDRIADPRLRLIAHDRPLGAGAARNAGAHAATGDWVAFLDDDDEWMPAKLERQLALAPAGPAVLTCLTRVVTTRGRFVRPARPYRGDRPIDEWLFDRQSWTGGGEGFLQTSSLVVPRAMFDTLAFQNDRQHEDWELSLRAVKQLGYPLLTALEPLVVYHESDGASLSAKFTWRRSLEWIDGLGDLVTPRAYAAFCLAVIGQHAADRRAWGAIPALFGAATRNGRPTPKQLVAFALCWTLPSTTRRRLRQFLQAERPSPSPDAGDRDQT